MGVILNYNDRCVEIFFFFLLTGELNVIVCNYSG